MLSIKNFCLVHYKKLLNRPKSKSEFIMCNKNNKQQLDKNFDSKLLLR